jgi:N-acetylglucosamine-6-phosphate deacetylase
MLALTAKSLYTPLDVVQRPVVLVEDGRVVRIASQQGFEIPRNAELTDFRDSILAPGLVDIHIHGGAGHDVMKDDAGGRRRFEKFLTSVGVTSYFPTTLTASMEVTLRALDRLSAAIESSAQTVDGSAQPLGIHMEGPFLSHQRRGVHPPQDLLKPSLSAFEKFWQAARGKIRVMTIAPELDGALEVIAEASRRGVCVSVGHSDADMEATQAGVKAGARHATHTFNAMRPLDHRAPGILGEVLSNLHLTAEVIADGVHVHPSVVELLLKAKGRERAVLVTDATAATGMPEGRYMLGDIEVEVKDGRCTNQGNLAGSVLTLDRAVRNVVKFASWNLQDAVRLATMNPANVANAKSKGVLEAGADADLIAITAEGDIRAAVVKGVLAGKA